MNQPATYYSANYWLEKIYQLPLEKSIRILNVCGGHERTLTHAGIRSLLPEKLQIIPGPGCPVCVCDEKTLQFAITLALQTDNCVLSFGDMLRVPNNAGRSQIKSLEQARTHGANVIAISSPQEVMDYANQHPELQCIFFAAGFETTAAPIAAMIELGLPDNLTLLLALKKTWPVVCELLSSDTSKLDGIVAPGHVATIMGSDEWQFVNTDFKLPCTIGGFSESSLLAAIYSVTKQIKNGTVTLENCYGVVAKKYGNQQAQQVIQRCFDVTSANWRGIGETPRSGFTLKQRYAAIDARNKFQHLIPENTAQQNMPAGCDCSKVVLGKISPMECPLYQTACTPANPIGPCMVSDEGACHIWWSAGYRRHGS